MKSDLKKYWTGLSVKGFNNLQIREYSSTDIKSRLVTGGVNASELVGDITALKDCWIPGVEIIKRRVFQQRHRGYFSELVRTNEGRVSEINFKPQQYATATMYAGTSKGFHIHPPFIPDEYAPDQWFKKLFFTESDNYSLRNYDKEQWDLMFFIKGNVEILLVDERAGMQNLCMRFYIDGDDMPGENNVSVVIPPGVAHAIRVASGDSVIMAYGTSIVFDPANEGRIGSQIETANLPLEWIEELGL